MKRLIAIHVLAWSMLSAQFMEVDCPGLAVTTQPSDQVACVGETANFEVTATGTGTLHYQWRKNCEPLAGETNATLMLAVDEDTDFATYDCVVSDDCGVLITDGAALLVASPEMDPYIGYMADACLGTLGEGVVFSVEGVSEMLTWSYQWRLDCVPIPGATESTYTINAVDAGDLGAYTCVVYNECASFTPDPLVMSDYFQIEVTNQPQDTAVCVGEDVVLSFDASFEPGTIVGYRWYKGANLVATTPNLTLNNVTADDAGDYRCEIRNMCSEVFTDTATVTVGVGPNITNQPDDVRTCPGSSVSFNLTAITGNMPISYQWRHNGMNIPGETGATLSISPVTQDDIGVYDCVVTDACGSDTTREAALELDIGVAQQPISPMVCPGDDAMLSVVATGQATITYQWLKNGQPIVGATLPTLALTGLTFADEATYTCTISNPCGTLVSDAAVISFDPCPVTIGDPVLAQRLTTGDWLDGETPRPVDANDDELLTFGELRAVTGSLDLSGLALTTGEGLGFLSNLHTLILSDSSLAQWTDLGEMTGLRVLEMERMTALPDPDASDTSQFLPAGLTHLVCSRNQWRALPDLSRPTGLSALTASHNRLRDTTDIAAGSGIGGTVDHFIDLTYNLLAVPGAPADCSRLSGLLDRTNLSGATFLYAPQWDYSELVDWPTPRNVADFVQRINNGDWEVDPACGETN